MHTYTLCAITQLIERFFMWTKIYLTDSTIVKCEGGYWYFILDGKQYKLNELSYIKIKTVIEKLEAYLKRNGTWQCNTVSYDELKNILLDHLDSLYHFELSKIAIRINKYGFRYKKDDKFWTYFKVLGGNYLKKIDLLSIEELTSIRKCFDNDDVTITYSTTIDTKITTNCSSETNVKLVTDNLMNAIDTLLRDKMKEQTQPAVSTTDPKIKYTYYNIILSKGITVRHDSTEWKVTINNEEFPLKLLSNVNIELTIEALEAFIEKHGILHNSDIDLSVLLNHLHQQHNQNVLFNTGFNLLNFSIHYMPEIKDWGYENEANELNPLTVLPNRILKQLRNILIPDGDFATQHLYESISVILNYRATVNSNEKVNSNHKHIIAYETIINSDYHDIYKVYLSGGTLLLARNKQGNAVAFIERWLYREITADETVEYRAISDNSKKALRSLSDTVLQEEIVELESNNLINDNIRIELLRHIAKVISNKKLAKQLD